MCARFYRRADGTILTKDCPVGKAKLRQRLAWSVGAGFVVLLAGVTRASTIIARSNNFEATWADKQAERINKGLMKIGLLPEPSTPKATHPKHLEILVGEVVYVPKKFLP